MSIECISPNDVIATEDATSNIDGGIKTPDEDIDCTLPPRVSSSQNTSHRLKADENLLIGQRLLQINESNKICKALREASISFSAHSLIDHSNSSHEEPSKNISFLTRDEVKKEMLTYLSNIESEVYSTSPINFEIDTFFEFRGAIYVLGSLQQDDWCCFSIFSIEKSGFFWTSYKTDNLYMISFSGSDFLPDPVLFNDALIGAELFLRSDLRSCEVYIEPVNIDDPSKIEGSCLQKWFFLFPGSKVSTCFVYFWPDQSGGHYFTVSR